MGISVRVCVCVIVCARLFNHARWRSCSLARLPSRSSNRLRFLSLCSLVRCLLVLAGQAIYRGNSHAPHVRTCKTPRTVPPSRVAPASAEAAMPTRRSMRQCWLPGLACGPWQAPDRFATIWFCSRGSKAPWRGERTGRARPCATCGTLPGEACAKLCRLLWQPDDLRYVFPSGAPKLPWGFSNGRA